MHCRVAAVQISLGKDSLQRAIEDAKNLIQKAAKSGAQIVCLPEHWLLEYWKDANGAVDKIAEAARTEHVFLITGANYTRSGSNVHIRSLLIDPNGNIVGSQDKIHLFRDEGTVAAPGESYETFQTPFGKVGITVCYDNVFPEAARTLALRGADLLFVPSRIISEGLDPWLLYLRTRALENRIPIIAPNVFDPPRYLGGSVIIDLKQSDGNPVVLPRVVASAGSGETVIVADVDIENARILRSKRLSERMPSTYV
jgi:predicted amidohydrolase